MAVLCYNENMNHDPRFNYFKEKLKHEDERCHSHRLSETHRLENKEANKKRKALRHRREQIRRSY